MGCLTVLDYLIGSTWNNLMEGKCTAGRFYVESVRKKYLKTNIKPSKVVF